MVWGAKAISRLCIRIVPQQPIKRVSGLFPPLCIFTMASPESSTDGRIGEQTWFSAI